MVKYENECVSCPPEMGCLGESCPNRNVKRLYCDECKEEVETLYIIDGQELCQDCLLENIEKINLD